MNLTRKIAPWVYSPSFRKYYADLKLFSDQLSGYSRLRKLFEKKMGYPLDLRNPQSFNQKVVWKKLFDRNPLLTLTADKLAVRGYIENLLGPKEASRILIPLLFSSANPAQIPFDELPDRFVVKPNHGCKMHIIVNSEKEMKRQMILDTSRNWLNTAYGLFHYEWAYRNIKPRIMVEELLQTKDGQLPRDYKFYCFHGKCRLIRASSNRFGKEERSAYFDVDWNLLPAYNPGYEQSTGPIIRPLVLDQAISLAERLSVDFDAVRMDLYIVDDRLYFGEYTHYDASGLARFEPTSFDFELGQHWKLVPHYWRH